MRVLVMRPQAEAERTARELAARGHEAVLAPVLRIAQTDMPAPSGQFDAVVLTSANAVPALATLGAPTHGLPVFAVGERTASAAAEAGCRDVRRAGGDAASLADLVARTAAPGAKLLLIAGRDRKPEPEAALSVAGFAVVTWVAYEAVAVERFAEGGRNALREGRLDAALHYSRRSAGVAVALADAGMRDEFRALAHVCLSVDTAVPLREAGARLVTVAATPDEPALLNALDECAATYDKGGSRATQSR